MLCSKDLFAFQLDKTESHTRKKKKLVALNTALSKQILVV